VRLDWFLGDHSRAILSEAKAKADYQAQVHLGKMVPMIVRREMRLVAQWPKKLK
jgi:hypothetical protein